VKLLLLRASVVSLLRVACRWLQQGDGSHATTAAAIDSRLMQSQVGGRTSMSGAAATVVGRRPGCCRLRLHAPPDAFL